MVGGINRQLAHPGDAVEKRAGDDRDGVPGFGAWVRLFVRQRARDLGGNVLDQRAAERDVEELLAAADAEQGLVGGEGAARDRQAECGPAALGWHLLVAGGSAPEGGG